MGRSLEGASEPLARQEEALITLVDAAKLAVCSHRTIQRWVATGRLPTQVGRDGRHRVSPRRVLEIELEQRSAGRIRRDFSF